MDIAHILKKGLLSCTVSLKNVFFNEKTLYLGCPMAMERVRPLYLPLLSFIFIAMDARGGVRACMHHAVGVPIVCS